MAAGRFCTLLLDAAAGERYHEVSTEPFRAALLFLCGLDTSNYNAGGAAQWPQQKRNFQRTRRRQCCIRMRSTRSTVSTAPTGKWCRRSTRFSRASRSRITMCMPRPAPCSARARPAASRSTTASRGASPTRMAGPAFSSRRATWRSCSAQRRRLWRAFRPGTTTASRYRSTRRARRTACRAFSKTLRCD